MRMVFATSRKARSIGKSGEGVKCRRCGAGLLLYGVSAAACSPTYLIPNEDYRLACDPHENARVVRAIRSSDARIVGLRCRSVRPTDPASISVDNPLPQNTTYVRVRGRGWQHPLWKTGASLTLSSVGPLILGPTLMAVSMFGRYSMPTKTGFFYSGMSLSILSGGLLASGVPLWITGGIRGRPQEAPLPYIF